jgi:DnaJ-class molecular chaperone
MREIVKSPCERCLGTGKDPEDESETQDDFLCRECGGSGKQGVSGCSLAPRGEHVEVK